MDCRYWPRSWLRSQREIPAKISPGNNHLYTLNVSQKAMQINDAVVPGCEGNLTWLISELEDGKWNCVDRDISMKVVTLGANLFSFK